MHTDTPRVVVIGGGHNGLIAAGLLAKRGCTVTLVEKRDRLGGASVTEQPFGPDYQVTALSYVVSLLPDSITSELGLHRHGYRVHPQHGYVVPFADGRMWQLGDTLGETLAALGRHAPGDVDAYRAWDAWLGEVASVLGPLLGSVPPKLGSMAPRDLWEQAKLGFKLRGLGVAGVSDVTRLFTMSIADLLEERFESSELRGILSVSGVIGTWAGPRSPGTAYVMAHHKIGDVGEGQLGAWGFPHGGMGGLISALEAAAREAGATVRTGAGATHIDVRGGAVTAVVLDSQGVSHFDAVSTCVRAGHRRALCRLNLRVLHREALGKSRSPATPPLRWEPGSGSEPVEVLISGRRPDGNQALPVSAGGQGKPV
jgi:phytoene dehydrogenase-like protein